MNAFFTTPFVRSDSTAIAATNRAAKATSSPRSIAVRVPHTSQSRLWSAALESGYAIASSAGPRTRSNLRSIARSHRTIVARIQEPRASDDYERELRATFAVGLTGEHHRGG